MAKQVHLVLLIMVHLEIDLINHDNDHQLNIKKQMKNNVLKGVHGGTVVKKETNKYWE